MSGFRAAASLSLALGLAVAGFIAVSAQTPAAPGDAFYTAIRSDDIPALRKLIAAEGANARGSSGLSPLTLAAGFGSKAAVQLLVDAGANVNPGGGAVAPLHLGWRDRDIFQLLLEHGADVNARTGRGRTALVIAAAAQGTLDVVSQLLAKGADVNAADSAGTTALIAAAAFGNGSVARLLLERGANPDAYAKDAVMSTALMGAAATGDVELTRMLLARKVSLVATSTPYGGQVKNGPVKIGTNMALHFAVDGDSPEIATLLLDAGAPIDAADTRGMTPFMFAVATDNPKLPIVRLLAERGASLTLATPEGETAVDWARKYNHPAVMKTLGAPPVSLAASPVAVSSHRSHTPQEAAERNLSQLRNAAGRVMTDGGCVACHAQPMAALATTLATQRGWRAEPVTDAIMQMQQAVNGALQPLLQFTIAGGAPEGQLYDLLAIGAAGGPPTLSIDALLHYLAGTQSSAGQWHRSAINRAPIQNGDVSRTALAINAFAHYSPPARAAEFKAVVSRAASWLARQEPTSTEERVMQLLGQSWAGAAPAQLERQVSQLLALQQPDGGWSQSPYLRTDAYATGQAIYALAALKVPPTHAAIQKGIAYLLATQQTDGTWHVRSRAMPIQPYFESGFPYEHDQWISFAGTAWADMALASSAESVRTTASVR